MENNTISNFENLQDLQAVLDDTASDIAQVLPDDSLMSSLHLYN